MKRAVVYIIVAILAGAALFFWGYRRGVSSVDVRDSVSVQLRPLPPIKVTVREPWPVVIREPADTVWKTLPADTAEIIADYLRERDYRLDFSTDTTGVFLVNATVGRNRLLTAEATIEPLLREVSTVRTVYKTVAQEPKWSVEIEATATLHNQWAGVSVNRNFGPFSLSGAAGYDPFRKEPVFELRGRLPLWRSRTQN